MSFGTGIKEKEEIKVKKPSMYRVILHNDDYTTMDFVVEVLRTVFGKSSTEAGQIMLDVHNKGKGIVGLYTYDIAMTKAMRVRDMAKKEGHPLKVTVEKE